MTNLLAISFVILQLSQVTLQLEPESGWITNDSGNLTVFEGQPIRHETHLGPTVKIEWAPDDNVILQQSSDARVWFDVPVRFINSSGWLAYPTGQRYYRLRGV